MCLSDGKSILATIFQVRLTFLKKSQTFTERVASVNAKIYKLNFYNPKIPISFWYRIVDISEKSVGVVGRGLGWYGVGMEPN